METIKKIGQNAMGAFIALLVAVLLMFGMAIFFGSKSPEAASAMMGNVKDIAIILVGPFSALLGLVSNMKKDKPSPE